MACVLYASWTRRTPAAPRARSSAASIRVRPSPPRRAAGATPPLAAPPSHGGAPGPPPLGSGVDRHDGDRPDGIALIEEDRAYHVVVAHGHETVHGREAQEEVSDPERHFEQREGRREAVPVGGA